jgi:hypothetical protein
MVRIHRRDLGWFDLGDSWLDRWLHYGFTRHTDGWGGAFGKYYSLSGFRGKKVGVQSCFSHASPVTSRLVYTLGLNSPFAHLNHILFLHLRQRRREERPVTSFQSQYWQRMNAPRFVRWYGVRCTVYGVRHTVSPALCTIFSDRKYLPLFSCFLTNTGTECRWE